MLAVEKKPQGRLKGKDKKKAKEASAAAVKNTIGTSQPKTRYTLAIRDFVPLAEHITGLKDFAIDVPSYFTTALDRVILARRQFSTKLKAAGFYYLDGAFDARHSYFIGVLEKVRVSLTPLLEANVFDFTEFKNGVPKDHVKNDRARATPLRNLFEVLDVYEPSPEFLRAPDVTPPHKPEELECIVEFDEGKSFAEALFAMTTLISELASMRAEVAQLWAKYSAGALDLAAVSMATNTAIELAHTLQIEMQPIIDAQGDITVLHKRYFDDSCKGLRRRLQLRNV